jgi:hypothetical protein
MSPTQLKMQPTIHLQNKPGNGRGQYTRKLRKCIVGCIFNCVGLIITREKLCICILLPLLMKLENFIETLVCITLLLLDKQS